MVSRVEPQRAKSSGASSGRVYFTAPSAARSPLAFAQGRSTSLTMTESDRSARRLSCHGERRRTTASEVERRAQRARILHRSECFALALRLREGSFDNRHDDDRAGVTKSFLTIVSSPRPLVIEAMT